MNAIEQAKKALEELTSLVKQRYSEDDADVHHEVLKAESALSALSAISAEPVSEQNARFAIDGAITYGRQGINKPPSEDHWLMPFWQIGRQLAAQPITADIVDEMNAAVMNGELPVQCEEAVDWLERRRVAAQPERAAPGVPPSTLNFGAILDALDGVPNDIRAEIGKLEHLIQQYADSIDAQHFMGSETIRIHVSELYRSDDYGVDGSTFYACRLCDQESGAGLLNKGVEHKWDCPLHPDNIGLYAAPASPSVASERDAVDARRWAGWIVGHRPDGYKDWACKHCTPHSDLLIEDFVCSYHQAVFYLDAIAAIEAKEGKS